MPCAAQSLRASSAGSWPGSSLSGRLLIIGFVPEAGRGPLFSVLSAPAAVRPGASCMRGGIVGIGRLRKAKRAAMLQPVFDRSNPLTLGGVLSRTLHQVARANPEAFKPAQRHRYGLQILVADRGLVQ